MFMNILEAYILGLNRAKSMPRRTYGSQIKARVRRLLEALFAFVNWDFDFDERDLNIKIEAKWEGEDTHHPKLIVRTTLADLERLTAQDKYPHKLSKAQIREALYLLRDFLQILEDNRTKTQGALIWNFTLKLWSKSKDKNLQQFDLVWEACRSEKSKDLERTIKQSGDSYQSLHNWHDICQQMLGPHKRLTTNQMLSAHDDMKFELGSIYVPLAVVQRSKPDRRCEDVLPEEGSKLYAPISEGKQRFEHEDFLAQVLQAGVGSSRGRRIALIGEPGAGKTTRAQAIAFWILNNNLGLPIWISLADLPREDGHLKSLDEYLLTNWLVKAIPKPRLTDAIATDFTNQFDLGQVWLFLDGVGETRVETGNFASLHWVASQLQGWVGKARVVLTCRVNVWEGNINPLEEFETYRLLGFDYPEQVHEFIRRWFHLTQATLLNALNPRTEVAFQSHLGNAQRGSNQGERLWNELDKPENQRLQDLVKNPLRLALLCSIWQCGNDGRLDTNAELYQQLVRAFYIWNQTRFPTTCQQQQQLNTALGRLAKRAMEQEKWRFLLQHQLVCAELGDSLNLALELGWINQVGLAGESVFPERVYAFFHPVFQEYFATADTGRRGSTEGQRWGDGGRRERFEGYEIDRNGD
jgi:predicted NACHT family NTPase